MANPSIPGSRFPFNAKMYHLLELFPPGKNVQVYMNAPSSSN
jgi:hypothetical protein